MSRPGFMAPALLLLAGGCAGPDVPDRPTHTGETPDERTAEVRADRTGMVTEQDVTVVVDPDTPVDLVCTHSDDPQERHVLHSDAASPHLFELQGLLPDTVYSCSASAEGVELASLEFTTDPPPWLFPELEVEGGGVQAYTVFNHFVTGHNRGTHVAYIADARGGIRWYHDLRGRGVGVEVAPIPNGMFLAGESTPPTTLLLDGTVVDMGPEQPPDKNYHHDGALLPSGDTLALRSEPNEAGGVVWEGFAVELRTPPDPEPHWSWSSQQAVDAGLLPAAGAGSDPYHANAAVYVEDADGPAVYISLYKSDAILRLDVALGEITWALGRNRGFTLVDTEGTELGEEDWFYGQHGLDVDGDRLYLYDNGVARPDGTRRSRAIAVELDVAARTATLAWTWEEPGWFAKQWGDIDLLPDGRVLIAQARDGSTAVPAGPDLRTSYVEVDPETNEVVHRLIAGQTAAGGYRAQRLDPCAYFANRAFCPDPG